jgi:hypothetical protein
MNTEQLKIYYPTIAKATSLYKLQQIQVAFKELQDGANNLTYDETENIYLTELELFIEYQYSCEITKIKKRKALIKRTKEFDIRKVKYLPPDVIGEIKSYLQPEIKYATQFIMIRSIRQRYSSVLEIEGILMRNVPKKILMDLVAKCKIYPRGGAGVMSSEQKYKWCRMIMVETSYLVSSEKSITRMDKLLALHNAEYSSNPNEKTIDKWYKFFLYIFVFKKHREELENNIKTTDANLTTLKNKKIVVK